LFFPRNSFILKLDYWPEVIGVFMRLPALFVMHQDAFEMVYGPEERRQIDDLVHVLAPPMTRMAVQGRPDLLSRVHVLISGWGGPTLDTEFLQATPRLQAVFFGGGSVSNLMTPAAWERGIVVTSAYAANAIPVAEYSLATILFSLKHGWRLARDTREKRFFPPRDTAPGCFERTVGLVSLGIIARTLLQLLKPHDLRVLVYDPFVSEDEAHSLGAEKVSLPEIFRQSDAVSIHAPLLPETRGMIDGELMS
jgi:phosphoglycerate dehydrogenase-like enzyme